MPSSGLGAYQVKIHQIIFGGLFLLVVLMSVRTMMFGVSASAKQLAAFSVAIGLVLALDKYYWVMYPVLSLIGVKIPGLPFDGVELGSIVLVSVFFIRQAMHKEHHIKISSKTLVVFPVFFWICFVWFLNPTGLAIFGSSSIGARYYFKIVLGLLAFLVLSALRLGEGECKILFRCLILSAVFSLTRQLFFSEVARMDAGIDAEEITTRYELLGALSLYTFIFCRYSLSQVLTSVGKFTLVLIFAALTVYSGKRRGFGTLFLVPMLRTFFTGRDKLALAACGFVFAFFAAVSVVGHGAIWELPRSAQRALSVVVPAFKTSSAMGRTDLFRQELRRYGREIIRENPWFGRKGFAMDRGETSWILFGGSADNIEGHAFSGNWHSTWYAFAADFGVPCAVLWGIGGAIILFVSYKNTKKIRDGTYQFACLLYYAYYLFGAFVFSYTSGHSSLSVASVWGAYGMVLAISGKGKESEPMKVGVSA